MSDQLEEEMIDDVDTIIKSINAGEYDSEINRIVVIAEQRKRHLALKQGWSLRPGDKVQVTGGRPHYMIGATGTIRKVMQSWVILDLDIPCGKFHRNIRCPMTILSKA